MSMQTSTGLGRCAGCGNQALCMSGAVVTCESCGRPHPEHPASVAEAEARKFAKENPPRAITVLPSDFPRPIDQRLASLERQVKEQADEIAELKQAMAQRAGHATAETSAGPAQLRQAKKAG